MTLKNMLITALVVAGLYVGIQFSGALVGHMQIKNILETEALDGRRNRYTEEEIIQNVMDHMNRTNTNLPEEFAIAVDGIGDPETTRSVEMDYQTVVDIKVHQFVLNLTASGDADPPLD